MQRIPMERADLAPEPKLGMVGVGPQKAGTSWLYFCLKEHPQLCFPKGVKETFFMDERFARGWPWYWSHFHHRLDGQLCSEIGPTYFDVPEAAKRLREHSPECRIIINLRSPADRSFSLYLHHRKKGRLHGDFREAIRQMPRIVDSSRYRIHVSRWLEEFGPQQVLILLQDDIASSPERVLERVYEFAGLDPVPPPATTRQRVNAASLPAFPGLARAATHLADRLRDRRLYGPIELAKRLGLKRVYNGFRGRLPTLDPEMRKQLVEEFEPDIAYVERLLERPMTNWRRSS